MRKRTFILGLVCWLGFFALGVQWMFNPFGVKIHPRGLLNVMILMIRSPVKAPASSDGEGMCDNSGPPVVDLREDLDFSRGFDIETTRQSFPLRLARLENSGIRDHADRIANESTDEVVAFDYWEWAFRESCSRFIVFMLFWGGSGWLIQWLVTRVVRGPGSLARKRL